MKFLVLEFIILTNCYILFGQNFLLPNLDLDNKDYAFYLLNQDGHTEVDSVYSYYTLDIKKMKKIRQIWQLNPMEDFHRCGYNFKGFLFHKDSLLCDFDITSECNSLILNNKSYEFTSSIWEKVLNELTPVEEEIYKFEDIKEGRKYFKKISRLNSYLSIPYLRPKWVDYDGFFTTKITDYDNLGVQKIIEKLNVQLKKKCPKSIFFITYSSASTNGDITTYRLKIYSTKSLYEDIEANDLNITYKGKWKPIETIRLRLFPLD